MMFPAFSKLDPQKDKEVLKNIFQFSVKYAALIVVPVTSMVIALAKPGIGTIFQDKYVQAPLFLALLSVSYLFSAFGNLSATYLMNGQGYTKYVLKLNILTAAIGFPLSFVLISQFGVIGLIVVTLTASLPSLFIGLNFIKKHFEVSVDWGSSAKILLSSAIAAILTYGLISQLPFSNPLQLVIGIVVFVIVFIVTALVTRTINRADLSNLREITSAFGPLRKPLHFLLTIIEKLMKLLQKTK
jgi:O-antigen/teichoic acid export membrane protein